MTRTVALTVPRTMAICGVLTVVAVLLARDPAPFFVYDASQYWLGAQGVAEGEDVYVFGGLDIRGAGTTLVYLPAYLAARALGASAADQGWAVLVQNALTIAVLGSVIVPLVVRRIVSIGPVHVVISSVLTGLAFSGFAPYPLVDLPAVVAAVLAVLLVTGPRWWSAVPAGVSIAVAVNLRPAYTLAAALLLVVVALTRWRRALPVLVGAGGVLAVQALYGWQRTGVVSVWAPEAAAITAIQLTYAAYGVRYDTIPYTHEDPRLWHCSPGMAEAVGPELPHSSGELLGIFVETLPTSAVFAVDKVAASLQWSWATPYAAPGEQFLQPLGLFVGALAGVGIIALVGLVVRHGDRSRLPALALLALALGSAVTLVGSSPEARFAAPLVAIGIIGCVAAAALHRSDVPSRTMLARCVAAVGVSVLMAWLGWHALQHDVPRGDVTTTICQAR